MGTPQKGNGDHKNRSAAGGRDKVQKESCASVAQHDPKSAFVGGNKAA